MTDQHDVTAMFDAIAHRYDFLNHLLSFRMDFIWRRKASGIITSHHPTTILDVATGTADLAIRMAHDNPDATITGIDCSEKMLEIGREKAVERHLERRLHLLTGNAEKLPFPDCSFDAVTCAFGVRNFENLQAGLKEMMRVTRNGGIMLILEFAQPTHPLVKLPYRSYSKHWLPHIGHWVSGHPSAYSYLPDSIERFSESDTLTRCLHGLSGATIRETPLCGGIVCLYECLKKTGTHHNK